MSQVLDPVISDGDIDWNALAPPCERKTLLPLEDACENQAEIVAELRHIEGACKQQGRTWFICKPCYEEVKEIASRCRVCGEPAALYEIQ